MVTRCRSIFCVCSGIEVTIMVMNVYLRMFRYTLFSSGYVFTFCMDSAVSVTQTPQCFFIKTGDCFTNVSRALQNNLAKIHITRNHIYGENFKLKLCMCTQSHALGTRLKFQLEILIGTKISAIHKFHDNILESLRNVSETTPWNQTSFIFTLKNNV